MQEYSFETELNGKTLTLKTGKIAKQASGAVIAQMGETSVLVTVVGADKNKEGIDFLPLSVEYQEKIYSAGRIPGNYFRREQGRPSEKEILTCRLIDRPIRPLFADGYGCETQVIATVMSMDKENEPDVLAMIATFAALHISELPFEGPIAAVRVARVDGEFVINPTLSQIAECDINIVLACSKTGVTMVEAGAKVVSEADMIEALEAGHNAIQPLIELQEQMRAAVGREKRVVEAPVMDESLYAFVEGQVAAKIKEALQVKDKMERKAAVSAVKKELVEGLSEEQAERKDEISEIFGKLSKKVARSIILEDGHRIDGRAFDEIRNISCDVNVLARPHGSALFTRGETQVMGILTLGSGMDEQRVETLSGDTTKPFMLHYNFPPYSVGECKRVGAPSRREIGHGALAFRAIEPILPTKEDFEYTVRLVSEVTESNGSSSMGTVCSCTLALMDGGVPISTPVSGIAMGLVKEGDKVAILSDILGDEDHTGDMDFKVAGTAEGITALQMDIKINELPKEIMVKALEQARTGRLHILDRMLEAIDAPREEISVHAPKVHVVKINPDKIRDIIGPGGKNIRQIQADTNTRLEVSDDGTVKITAVNAEDAAKAVQIVNDIGTDPEPGEEYEGTVVKIADFGAFVAIRPGVDGLVHISELAHYRVNSVSDIVSEGDKLKVRVLEVTRDGKIRLSHKAMLPVPEGVEPRPPREDRGGRRDDRGGRRDDRGRGGRGGRGGNDRGRR
ncbi:polyribonucleotide nucleotidyltransferase [Desulfoluna spongiiphila]|uniref:Polyribonucleotide nucleotidyltransferase n=1 Tax=Desulfoluna spongiiphila TaxID=419481 RepID=A0A1G5GNU8_9BACT|nr:polyribonucleotide nucleotidyltransferase [Desulfoluna spongiiphila]SCY53009.1 polyribonucleotide nucleotidyltransferase [Desulfoluna spongiiphila]